MRFLLSENVWQQQGRDAGCSAGVGGTHAVLRISNDKGSTEVMSVGVEDREEAVGVRYFETRTDGFMMD